MSARVRQGRTRVDVPPSPEVVLPPDGTVQNRSAKLVVARQVMSAHALHVRSSGRAEGSGSVESLAELNDVTFRDGLARASGVSARCRAEVGPDGKARVTADSVATLRQSGNEVHLRPGRSVDLRRLGRVVFDERVEAPGHDSVTVNALHFFLNGKLGRGEVVVGRARCSVGGSGGGPPPAIPESPMAILLPGSALLIGGAGAGVMFARRRRRGRP